MLMAAPALRLVRDGGVGDDAAAHRIDRGPRGRGQAVRRTGRGGRGGRSGRRVRGAGAGSELGAGAGAGSEVGAGAGMGAAEAIWSRRSMSCLTDRTKSPGVR